MGWGALAGAAIGAVGSLIGGKKAADNSKAVAKMNIEAQKEFAQNSIRWRVEDAKNAGIHPLYSLGASTNSFTPVSGYTGDYGISDAANTFGQGINRAVQAKMTNEERQALQAKQEMQETFQLADLNMRQQESDAKTLMYKSEALRNYAASQQALKDSALPPAMPSGRPQVMTGQGDSPYLDKPIPREGWLLDEKGRKLQPIPSEDLADRTEDKLVIEWLPWLGTELRNVKGKFFGQEVNGHWWHGEDKGYLPYRPPKTKTEKFLENAVKAMRFYRAYGH